MASSTPNLNLRKPADSDRVNVSLDIAGNMDLIDSGVALVNHTHSGTYVSRLSGTSAAQQPLVYRNVKDYGAVGDDATDDTAAIQAAINAGGVTLFPAGAYRISTLALPAGAHLRGVHSGGYGITIGNTLQSRLTRIAGTNQHMLTGAQGVAHVRIHDLHLDGNKNNNSAGDGINLADVGTAEEAQWHIVDCLVEAQPGYGVYIGVGRRAVRLFMSTVYLNGASGLRINGSDSAISNCIVGSNTVDGIQVGASVTHITDCDIFGNTIGGINVLSTIAQVMVRGCGIDRNGVDGIFVGTGANSVTIIGNDFHSNSQTTNGGGHHINVKTTTGGCEVVGNVTGTDSGITNAAGYFLFLDTNATATGIGNQVVSSSTNLGLTNDATRFYTSNLIVPAGATGATAASRYVGGTASGAPGSGTFVVGDFVIDQTGTVWVCTAAGTPGTWASKATPTAHASTHGPLGSDPIYTGPIKIKTGSGLYFHPQVHSGTSTSNTLGNGSLRVSPVIVPHAISIVLAGAEYTVAGDVASTFRILLFADNGSGYPGALVQDFGSISTGGTPGVVDASALGSPVALSAGLYWLGGVVQNVVTTQPTMRVISNTFPGVGFVSVGTSTPSANQVVAGYLQGSVTGSPPNPFSTSLSASGTIPRIHWKVQ